MPREIVLDLTGAPPAQGGGSDHVPPSRYRIRVSKVEQMKSKADKPMLQGQYVVTQDYFKIGGEDHTGARLGDFFVLAGESKFPLQRLHAFFLALGLPVKETAFKLDLDLLNERECDIITYDEDYNPGNGAATRKQSRVGEYHKIGENMARPGPGASNGAVATPAAQAPAQQQAPVQQAPVAQAPAVAPLDFAAIPPVAPAMEVPSIDLGPPVQPPVQQMVAAAPAQVASPSEIDDLFK